MPPIRIESEERRRRIGVRHHLHPDHRTASPAKAALDLVGLHSSDPATVFLSAWARTASVTIPEIEQALYGSTRPSSIACSVCGVPCSRSRPNSFRCFTMAAPGD